MGKANTAAPTIVRPRVARALCTVRVLPFRGRYRGQAGAEIAASSAGNGMRERNGPGTTSDQVVPRHSPQQGRQAEEMRSQPRDNARPPTLAA